MHWASGYIGTPWVAGVSDCWHFAVGIWRDRFGWQVPVSLVDPTNPVAVRRRMAQPDWTAQWAKVTVPVEGDAVLMRRGAYPSHVGIWVSANGGGILHSVEGSGVVLTPLQRLAQMNFAPVGYHRWIGA